MRYWLMGLLRSSRCRHCTILKSGTKKNFFNGVFHRQNFFYSRLISKEFFSPSKLITSRTRASDNELTDKFYEQIFRIVCFRSWKKIFLQLFSQKKLLSLLKVRSALFNWNFFKLNVFLFSFVLVLLFFFL